MLQTVAIHSMNNFDVPVSVQKEFLVSYQEMNKAD